MGRIPHEKVSEADGEVVPADHIVKGVEISKDRYVIVDSHELVPFVPLATKSIDIEQFVDPAELDPLLFDTTYFVTPAAMAAKPCALLVRALQSTDKVANLRVRDARSSVHGRVARRRRTADASTLAYHADLGTGPALARRAEASQGRCSTRPAARSSC